MGKSHRRPAWPQVAMLMCAVAMAGSSSPATAQTALPGADRAVPLASRSGAAAIEPDGTTPLHRAVLSDDVKEVGRLLRTGADARAATRYGVTPMALAVASGNVSVVKALIGAGADPNTVVGEGEPVLMSAVRAGHVDVVRVLLESGASVNVREAWRGQTALMWAAAANYADLVGLLLEQGADPNLSSDLLEFWAMVPSEQATPKIPMARGGMAALHYAARQGSLDAVRVLASAPGTNLNGVDPDGANALLYATLNGHFDVAALLLEKGADPNVADQYGRTVLFTAIEMNRPEFEPRPHLKSTNTLTPLGLAKLALAKGADPNSTIKGRIPNRCPLGCRAPGVEGATPLWRAAKSRDAEAVALLLASGSTREFAAGDGSTPFHMAAGMSWQDGRITAPESEAIDVLKLFLAAGVPIDAPNAAGETALHAAAARGADDVVRFLVESGADLAAKDKAQRTPLHVALGIAMPQVRQGGGAATNAVVREETAALLRQLMDARGVPAEPYQAPAAPAAP